MAQHSSEPITADWYTPHPAATAAALAEQLSNWSASELAPHHRALSLAGAELADAADITWPHSESDPVVALVRLIAKVAIKAPTTTGANTAMLSAQLSATAGDSSLVGETPTAEKQRRPTGDHKQTRQQDRVLAIGAGDR